MIYKMETKKNYFSLLIGHSVCVHLKVVQPFEETSHFFKQVSFSLKKRSYLFGQDSIILK